MAVGHREIEIAVGEILSLYAIGDHSIASREEVLSKHFTTKQSNAKQKVTDLAGQHEKGGLRWQE